MSVIGSVHGGILPLLLAVVLATAAGFVGWFFPQRETAIFAMVLAVAVFIAYSVGPLRVEYSGGGGLHSPAMGFGFFPVPALFFAQTIAAIGGYRSRNV